MGINQWEMIPWGGDKKRPRKTKDGCLPKKMKRNTVMEKLLSML